MESDKIVVPAVDDTTLRAKAVGVVLAVLVAAAAWLLVGNRHRDIRDGMSGWATYAAFRGSDAAATIIRGNMRNMDFNQINESTVKNP